MQKIIELILSIIRDIIEKWKLSKLETKFKETKDAADKLKKKEQDEYTQFLADLNNKLLNDKSQAVGLAKPSNVRPIISKVLTLGSNTARNNTGNGPRTGSTDPINISTKRKPKTDGSGK
jgi:hypothetical protein